MFDYTQSAATALALIEKFGKAYSIKRSVKTPVGVTGAVTAVDTVGEIKAVILPVNTSKEKFDSQELTDAVVKGQAKFLLVAAKGAPFEPASSDEVTVDSFKYRVAGCTALSPAGIPIIYNVGLVLK